MRIAADACLPGSTVDVAVMVAFPAATAVTSPVGLTVAAAAFEVDQVTPVPAPPTTATVAVSCAVVPAMSAVGGLGIVTERTAGRGFTVSVTFPVFVASNDDVAVIVAVPAATPVT